MAIALIASAALVVSAASNLSLPGCGPAGGCEQLSQSAWGSVPGLGVPISIVGLAYFTGTAAWWCTRGPRTPDRGGLWLVRVGAACSALLVVVMIASRAWCPYCVAAHVGNLAFALCAEIVVRRDRPGGATPLPLASRPLGVGITAGLVVLAAGTGVWWTRLARARADSSAALAAATDRVLAAPTEPASFRGRYVAGPPAARARIVVFTDFQCPQCRVLESELVALVTSRDDTNLSIKHFPLCAECNPAVRESLHEHACAAAIAAEAAGAVGGIDAFWQAASWMFHRSGAFTPDEFLDAAAGWGLDRSSLQRRLTDGSTADLVKADVHEALALEITRAPTVFINGVELRGWETPGAVRQAVEALASSPGPRSSADAHADRPADAQTRAVEQWLTAKEVPITPRAAGHHSDQSAAEPAVRVTLFGDYQDAFSAEADAIIRSYVQTWPGTRYEFRHFPASSTCNPRLTINPHPLACRMARAAEAARLLGGEVGFFELHAWLFQHRQDFSDAGLRAKAIDAGLDATVFLAATRDSRVQAALQADIDAGNALGITAIPAIYVNERPLAVWKTQRGELLTRVLDLAAQPPADPTGPAEPRR